MTATAPSTFTGTLTNSATAQDSYWLTRDAAGNITEEKIERNLYSTPPMGTYQLRLLRFSKPFELAKSPQYMKPGEKPTQTMTRLECRIVGGPGDGRKCTPMVSLSLGESAKLGQIVRAAIKRDLGLGEEFDLYSICHHLDPQNEAHDFMATLKPSDAIDEQTGKPKHCNIVDKTIAKVGSGEGGDGWVD